jgi:hypothetical protein
MPIDRWRHTIEWRKRVAVQLAAHPMCQRCRRARAVTVETTCEARRFVDFIRLPVMSLCQRCADQPKYAPYMGLDNKPRWQR